MPTLPLIATLEAGGTKMVASLASGPGQIIVRQEFPTLTPEESIPQLIEFYSQAARSHGSPKALAIGTFGPAELRKEAKHYGYITSTPKEGWSHTDLLSPIQQSLNVPAIFETDVHASLYGEITWGAARDLKHAAYFTVGTGIGGALMIENSLIYGLGHPEMGHMKIRRHPEDHFLGSCPFHGDCLEGLASGSAISQRWGSPAEELPSDHQAWIFQADYLAQACLNLLTIAPPMRIILGGGVMHQAHLFPLIREALNKHLNGYLGYPELSDSLDDFIVPPALGNNSALLGCVALGQELIRI